MFAAASSSSTPERGPTLAKVIRQVAQQLDNPGSDALIDRDAACCFE
jgi:hypothetical protein